MPSSGVKRVAVGNLREKAARPSDNQSCLVYNCRKTSSGLDWQDRPSRTGWHRATSGNEVSTTFIWRISVQLVLGLR